MKANKFTSTPIRRPIGAAALLHLGWCLYSRERDARWLCVVRRLREQVREYRSSARRGAFIGDINDRAVDMARKGVVSMGAELDRLRPVVAAACVWRDYHATGEWDYTRAQRAADADLLAAIRDYASADIDKPCDGELCDKLTQLRTQQPASEPVAEVPSPGAIRGALRRGSEDLATSAKQRRHDRRPAPGPAVEVPEYVRQWQQMPDAERKDCIEAIHAGLDMLEYPSNTLTDCLEWLAIAPAAALVLARGGDVEVLREWQEHRASRVALCHGEPEAFKVMRVGLTGAGQRALARATILDAGPVRELEDDDDG